jgi:hypothetical protein
MVARSSARLPKEAIFHINGASAFCAATAALTAAGNQKQQEDSKASDENTSDDDIRGRRASKVDAIMLNEVRKDTARAHPDLLLIVALGALIFR